MAPRVSVVMPVFNGARYIAEALGSVLASEFSDFEVLVLDDGSTDASMEIAARVAAGDPRVRLIHLPHGGIAAARNAGLEHARGVLIANLDSDDAMFAHRLVRQVAYLDRHPNCVAVGSRSVIVDPESRPIGIVGRFFTHEEIERSLLDGNGGAIGNDSAMIRKKAMASVGGYEAHLHATGEDHDLWLRLAEVGRLECPPEVLNRYRVHPGNVSAGEGSKERRLPVTLDTLQRAFARRGITGRTPAKIAPAPFSPGERARDRALLSYYLGDRRRAMLQAARTAVRYPRTPGMVVTLRTILGGPAPRWPRVFHDGTRHK